MSKKAKKYTDMGHVPEFTKEQRRVINDPKDRADLTRLQNGRVAFRVLVARLRGIADLLDAFADAQVGV